MARGGFTGWQNNLAQIEDMMIDARNNIVEELADGCREVCPVDTGTLKAGYKTEHSNRIDKPAKLINDVEYHNFVNDGTPTHRGHHMLEHAINKIDPDARKYIRR